MLRFRSLRTGAALDSPPRSREWLLVAAACMALAIAYSSPLYGTWPNWGKQDWDQHLTYHAVPYLTVMEYGEFPLWNPYSCGGMVMHANPQARVLSPFFPLHLVWGFLTGIKLEIVAHVAIGLFGAYALAREVLRSRTGAAACSAVFMLNGAYAHSLTVGMTWFTSVAYVPWAVLGFVTSERHMRYVWLLGAALALVFFTGGAYVLSVMLLGLFVLAAVECREKRTVGPLFRFALGSILGLGLGAVKFFPSISFLHSFPRPIHDYSGYSVAGLFTSLFDRNIASERDIVGDDTGGLLSGFSYGPDENYMYVGPVAGLLFAVGLWTAHEHRTRWLALVACMLWLSFGDRISPSLWQLLHTLPIYDSMRVAQRFRIAMMLGGAIFSGLGAMALVHLSAKRFGKNGARWGAVALVGLLVGDLISANHGIFRSAFTEPATAKRLGSVPFRQTTGDPQAMLPALLENRGTVNCYESANVPQKSIADDSPSYRGEAFLNATAGRVEIVEWSPNHLRLAVSAERSGRVIVNQQGYPGWSTAQGNAVSAMVCAKDECRPDPSGLIAIEVSPKDRQLDLYYRPSSFVLGAAVSGVFLLALGTTLWAQSPTGARVLARTRRRRLSRSRGRA